MYTPAPAAELQACRFTQHLEIQGAELVACCTDHKDAEWSYDARTHTVGGPRVLAQR